jgi:predicted transposase YbfD/YdcC
MAASRPAQAWSAPRWWGSQKRHRWPGLAAIGKVVRTRETASTAATETAYYLLSAALSPERLGQVARSHWGVENRLHWVLNTVMHEDKTRNRNDNSAYNLAILRHMALNLMQRDRSRGVAAHQIQSGRLEGRVPAELLSPI